MFLVPQVIGQRRFRGERFVALRAPVQMNLPPDVVDEFDFLVEVERREDVSEIETVRALQVVEDVRHVRKLVLAEQADDFLILLVPVRPFVVGIVEAQREVIVFFLRKINAGNRRRLGGFLIIAQYPLRRAQKLFGLKRVLI